MPRSLPDQNEPLLRVGPFLSGRLCRSPLASAIRPVRHIAPLQPPVIARPKKRASLIPGELIPGASVWLWPGITPCAKNWATSGSRPLHRHSREVMPERHVLGEFLLWNSLFDLQLSIFDPADVAIDDSDMVLFADYLVALRMRERIRHLHPFEHPDDALDVLARLVAGLLDRLLER